MSGEYLYVMSWCVIFKSSIIVVFLIDKYTRTHLYISRYIRVLLATVYQQLFGMSRFVKMCAPKYRSIVWLLCTCLFILASTIYVHIILWSMFLTMFVYMYNSVCLISTFYLHRHAWYLSNWFEWSYNMSRYLRFKFHGLESKLHFKQTSCL